MMRLTSISFAFSRIIPIRTFAFRTNFWGFIFTRNPFMITAFANKPSKRNFSHAFISTHWYIITANTPLSKFKYYSLVYYHWVYMINRQQLGQVIAKTFRGVRRINQFRYFVKSQSGNGKYVVSATKLGWVCSCPDQKFRGVKCKHIYAVEISYAIRKEVEDYKNRTNSKC